MNPIRELQLAGSSLAKAEQGIETDDEHLVKDASRKAIKHAAKAVALTYMDESEIVDLRSSILMAMEHMPPKLWAEALRLLEIVRSIDEENVQVLIDLAREAVEVAVGIVLTEALSREGY